MAPLLQDGLLKVGMGLTSLEEVLRSLPPDPGTERSCPRCSREMPEDFQVCPYCDPGLERSCPSCRRPAQADWRTCPYCRWSLREGAADPRPPSIEEELRAVPGFRRVLVADHEATSRAAILEALERAGLEVELADDGEEAMERIQSARPDLILANLRLPGVDGLELLRRTREQGVSTPVLLMHPDADPALGERVQGAGGTGVLGRIDASGRWLRQVVRALQGAQAPN